VADDQPTQLIPVGPAPEDTPSGATAAPGPDAEPLEVPDPLAASTRSLRRQRRRLVQDRDQMIFHLGGLAYELHLLGDLHAPVAERRAGMIRQIDTTLEAIDAQLAARGAPAATDSPLPIVVGSCRTCRTRFLANARYCMSCGASLAPPEPRVDAATPSAPKATT
jgi:hypothetical protein